MFYFIGIYFTLVEAYPSGKAGIQLLFYIPGIGGNVAILCPRTNFLQRSYLCTNSEFSVGVYLAMFACNVWPAQTFAPLSTGTLVESVGVALITWAVTTRNIPLINGMMAVAGAGTGLRFMPSSLHAAGIWPDKLAPAMSIMRFCLPFGGTLALAIMGSVFNNKMASIFHPSSTSSQSQSGRFDIHSGKSLDDINKLPPEVQEHIRNTGKDAVMWAFISIMPIMVISFVSGIFLGNVWIKKKRGESVDQRGQASSTPPADDEENIESNEVVYVSYLWALLTVGIFFFPCFSFILNSPILLYSSLSITSTTHSRFANHADHDKQGTLDDKKCITKPLTKAQKQRQAAALLEEKQHRAKLGHNPTDAENYILTSNPHPSKPT